MNWPEQIDIQGTIWTLDIRRIGEDRPPVDCYGEMDNTIHEISLYLTGQDVEDMDTFIHEVLEAGIRQGLDIGTYDENQKEIRIRGIARLLAQVLVKNELVKT